MSSWRNLMTPLYEKCYLKDSCSSSLNQSHFAKKSSILLKDNESSVHAGGYNNKLNELHAQMNKLKGDLNKYSTREKNTRKSSTERHSSSKKYMITEPDQRVDTLINEESSLGDMEEHHTPKGTLQSMSPEPERDLMSDKRKGRKLENIQTDDSTFIKRYQTEMMSMNQTLETQKTLEKVDLGSVKTYIGIRSQEKEGIKYGNKTTTQKPRKKTFSRDLHENEEIAESNSLRDALTECRLQIKSLQEIALGSQEQINFLCEELSKEKKRSQELKEELQKMTVPSSIKKQEISFAATPLRKQTGTGNKYSSQEVIKRIPLSSKQKNPLLQRVNLDFEDFDTHVDRDYKQETKATFLKLKRDNNRREDESTKDFSSLRNESKEIGVQCDFMLDDIIGSSEDLEAQKEENTRLKSEINVLKAQKNEMIEAFQQIVGILAAPVAQKTKAAEEIQNGFSDFYNALNAKMGDAIGCTQKFSSNQKQSKFSGFVSNYMGKSKHNRTEISDNLMYSPSNTLVSFDDELMESRINGLINSLKGSHL